MNDQLLHLRGDPYQRGLTQAHLTASRQTAVRAAIASRLVGVETLLQSDRIKRYLGEQALFIARHDPAGQQELNGLAEGYGFTPNEMLAYLHANILQDMQGPQVQQSDGCTAWAYNQGEPGALVVKNRDYRGEHGALQRVFVHTNKAGGERAMLCVGSLGSPGAFSSGMNEDGLAVVDTQIATHDHGVGWLRYFLMTALLRHCQSTAEALDFISHVAHAGGGTLVLGDASGACACVELGHALPPVMTRSDDWVARTNHYLDARLSSDMVVRRDDLACSTVGRLEQVEGFLASCQGQIELEDARALMSGHQVDASICSHAEPKDATRSRTLSSVQYETAARTLHMSHGNPCSAPWASYRLQELAGL